MQLENLTTAEAAQLEAILKPITAPKVLDRSVATQKGQFMSMFATVKGVLTPTAGMVISQSRNRILEACTVIDTQNGMDCAKIDQALIRRMDDVVVQVRAICKGSNAEIPSSIVVHNANGLDGELLGFGEKHGILTRSMIMEDALDNLMYLASLQQGHVLIRGETGTGKELFSKAIHTASQRSPQPFVIVDGAAADLNLIKDELLGHERGAFTGADRKKIGKMEKAGTGVVFIDEIGKWSFEAQGILLSILAGREMERIGGNGSDENKFSIQARIVAATNADLEELVNKGLFLEDLYYRLQQLRIELPPLRDRGEQDIELLANHFLQAAKREQKIDDELIVEPDAMQVLKQFNWPGNVRQLKHVTEQALVNANRERARQKRLAKNSNGAVHPIDIMLHHVNNALEPYRRITLGKDTEKKEE